MKPKIDLVVSIDTEEDNWLPTSHGVTCRNVRELLRITRTFEALGIRPTYFTSYQVAADSDAAAVMCEILAVNGAELGTHLHPWNTPPDIDASLPRFGSMLKNYPRALQSSKLTVLTDVLTATFSQRPAAFRAGRFGLDGHMAATLAHCGYDVDSSITPFVDWRAQDNGPDFRGCTPAVSYLKDQLPSAAASDIVEVPITVGFSRFSAARWPRVSRALNHPVATALRVPGIGVRTGLISRVTLSPEISNTARMIDLCRGALDGSLTVLHLFFHSSSLQPGLTPFTHSSRDVNRMVRRMTSVVQALMEMADVTFSTVCESAEAFRQGHHASEMSG